MTATADPATLEEPPPPRRLGGDRSVAFNLRSGLAALVLLTLIAAGLGLVGYVRLSAGIEAVTADTLPAIEQAARLRLAAKTIEANASNLPNMDDSFALESAAFNLRNDIAALDEAIAGLDPGLVETARRAAMQETMEGAATVVGRLQALIGERITADAAHSRMVSTAIDLTRRVERLGQVWGVDVAVRQEVQVPLMQAVATMSAALSSREAKDVLAQRESFEQRIAAARTAFAVAPLALRTVAEPVLTEVGAFAMGAEGLFSRRLDRLRLDLRIRSTLDRMAVINRLIGLIDGTAEVLAQAARDQAASLRGEAHKAGAGLVGVIAACLMAGLVITAYVNRRVIRRMVGLRDSMLSHVAGTPRPVDTAGSDEIAAMGRSFLHFVDAVNERERSLKQALGKVDAALAALAVEKAETERAFAELDATHQELEATNRLVVESIHYARRIQTAVLPDRTALGTTVADIHVCWEPLHVVGGDYFWLEVMDGNSLLFIGDCTGHGVPGAFMTLVVASALDHLLHERRITAPSALLAALDDAVRQRLRQDRPDTESDDGLEAAICLWNPAARTLTFAAAGLPLVYVENGAARTIRGDRAVLGYRSLGCAPRFTEHRIDVRPGMDFYMFTDGAHDHMGGAPQRRLFGRRRLTEILAQQAQRPMAEQMRAVDAALAAWRGDEPRRDDMTLVGVRLL